VLADVDFTLLFVADAVTMAIYGVIVLVLVPETRPPPKPRAERRHERSWTRDRVFVVQVVLTFFVILLPLQSGPTLAAHMTWQGFGAAAYGAVMATNGVLIIVLQPMLTPWLASRDPSRVLATAAALYGVGIALHGLASVLVVHVCAVAIWTLAEVLDSPTRSAVVAAMAPEHARGRYQGAIVMAWGAAQLVAPTAGTWVWDAIAPSVLWASCLGLGAVTALAFLATGPGLRRRISDRPSGSS